MSDWRQLACSSSDVADFLCSHLYFLLAGLDMVRTLNLAVLNSKLAFITLLDLLVDSLLPTSLQRGFCLNSNLLILSFLFRFGSCTLSYILVCSSSASQCFPSIQMISLTDPDPVLCLPGLSCPTGKLSFSSCQPLGIVSSSYSFIAGSFLTFNWSSAFLIFRSLSS